MIFIGFALAWGGYALGYWGLCLVQGRDVSPAQLLSPVHYLTGKLPAPGTASPDQIIPDGKAVSGQAGGGTPAGSVPGSAQAQKNTAARSVTGTVAGSRL